MSGSRSEERPFSPGGESDGPVFEKFCQSLRSQDYQRHHRRLFLARIFLTLFFLAVLIWSGGSIFLREFAARFTRTQLGTDTIYFLFLAVVAWTGALPLAYYQGWVLEKRFGLSRQTQGAWLKDELKKAGLGIGISYLLMASVYFFLRNYPDRWWLWASGVWLALSVILAKIFPSVILPLFFKPRPLEQGFLRTRLEEFLKKFPLRLREIYVLDFSRKTVKANAMVAGLGATKKIYLSDTLVDNFSPEEIELVLAHEVGHYLAHDNLQLIFVGCVTTIASFFCADAVVRPLLEVSGFVDVGDIATLPLFLFVLNILGLLLGPLQHGFARHLETRADDFALKVTRNADAFVSMMKRLGEKNLSDFYPPLWAEIMMYDHPPIGRRIDRAKKFEGRV